MKFIDALFCDDIRHEVNNKVSLMGLYHDRIIISTNHASEAHEPLPVNISILLRFNAEKIIKNPIQFTVEYLLNGKALVCINSEVTIESKGVFTLALTGSRVPLKQGALGFSIKIFDKNHEYLSERNESAIQVLVS